METNEFSKYVLIGIVLFVIIVAIILNFYNKPIGKILITSKLIKDSDEGKYRHFADLGVTNKTQKRISVFQPFVVFKFGHKTRSFKMVDPDRRANSLKQIIPGQSIAFRIDLDYYKKTLGDEFFNNSSVVFIVEDSAGLEYKSEKVRLNFENPV